MTTETEGAAPEVAVETPTEGQPALTPEQALEKEITGQDPPAEAHEAGQEGGEPAKPKQTAQERIDELTRARRDAEREAEFWKSKATQSQPASEPKQDEPKPAQGDGRPNPDDFEFGVTDEGYIEALAEWKAGEMVKRQFSERDARSEVVRTIESFKGRVAEAYPDGEPEGLKAYRAVEQVPAVLQDIVLRTAAGPKIAEHYGSNPDALKALMDMPPHIQAFEIGQVQARLATTQAAAPKKTASEAPDPPAHQSRGTGGQFKVSPDTDDFAAFEKAYP